MTMVPVRLATVAPEGEGTQKLLAHGGRSFVFRDLDGSVLGDRVCTLPGAVSDISILAPRGFGRPLLARAGAGGWRGLPNGEPCSAERWRPVGAVSAWFHAVEAPHRHFPLLAVGGLSVGHELVVMIRSQELVGEAQAVAARCMEGALLPVSEPDVLATRMDAMTGDPRHAMARAERMMVRLRSQFPDVRMAMAASFDAAYALLGCVDPGWIGLCPQAMLSAWTAAIIEDIGLFPGRRVGRWSGPAIPDIDGLISLARAMTVELPIPMMGGVVRVGLHGEKGFCSFRVSLKPNTTSQQAAGHIAASLCERFFQVGAVTNLSLGLVEETQPAREAEEDMPSQRLALVPQ